MKQKLSLILIGGIMMSFLTGCNQVIELTKSEEQIIAEYAADAVLEHFGVFQHTILEELVVPEEEEEDVESVPEPIIEPTDEEEPEEGIQVVIPEMEDVSANANISIEEFFGIDGLQITYKDYEVVKTYPEDSEDELYFSIDATEGNNLLILKFDLVNLAGEDYQVNMIPYNMKFKVGINGEAQRWVLSTMLLNDLSTYNETVTAGSTVEVVLAREIPEDITVDSISFMMKNGDSTLTKDLK